MRFLIETTLNFRIANIEFGLIRIIRSDHLGIIIITALSKKQNPNPTQIPITFGQHRNSKAWIFFCHHQVWNQKCGPETTLALNLLQRIYSNTEALTWSQDSECALCAVAVLGIEPQLLLIYIPSLMEKDEIRKLMRLTTALTFTYVKYRLKRMCDDGNLQT